MNVGDLGSLAPGTVVDESFLRAEGFVKGGRDGVKVLGEGELKTSLIFKVALYSESAKKKIEASGGKIESVKPAASEVKV